MPQATWLLIRALRLEGVRLGVYDHEKRSTTRVRIDVRLRLGRSVMLDEDRLAGVVDYVTVAAHIAAVARQRHYDLIETLACQLATSLMSNFLAIDCVRLRVQKPSGLASGVPGIFVHRTR